MRLAAVALATALLLSAGAGAVAQKTAVETYRPLVKGKLARGFRVTKSRKGECFAGSLADPRSDAWRCMFGNFVLDPCFGDVGARSVVCPEAGSPLDRRLLRVVLRKPLPKKLANRGEPGQGNPWAVKLTNGLTCTFLTGATFSFHRKRVNYGCSRTIFLAGSPNRKPATWTIALGTGPKSKAQRAAIAIAWW